MRHREKRSSIETAHPVAKVDDLPEAMAAQRETTARFVEAAVQGPEVRQLAAQFRGYRERNGFGELLTKSMRLR